MIKIDTIVKQESNRFIGDVKALFVDQYGKTTDFEFSHTFMNISNKYDFDLSALCIAVMAINCIAPGHRSDFSLTTPSQLVVDIANNKVIPNGIYKNYGDKLLTLLATFPKYKIVKY